MGYCRFVITVTTSPKATGVASVSCTCSETMTELTVLAILFTSTANAEVAGTLFVSIWP